MSLENFVSKFSLHHHHVRVLLFTLALTTLASAAEDLCQFSKYKDSKSLEASKQKLSPLVGKVFTSRDEENKFQYTVGICTKTDVDSTTGLTDVAVLQQGLLDDGSVSPSDKHDVGNLKDTHIMSGTDWIFLEYKSSETYGSHCSQEGKRTAIMIACDETVSDSSAKMVFLEEENQKEDSCYYLFEMKHQAVCAVPAGAGGLSVGSILVIVFVCVGAVYLLVGFLYSRFVLGAKGKEQIPNYEFWKDFGNLQADGCDLLCRTKERRRAGGFGGIGDDQLDQTEEVVRDENLLPM